MDSNHETPLYQEVTASREIMEAEPLSDACPECGAHLCGDDETHGGTCPYRWAGYPR